MVHIPCSMWKTLEHKNMGESGVRERGRENCNRAAEEETGRWRRVEMEQLYGLKKRDRREKVESVNSKQHWGGCFGPHLKQKGFNNWGNQLHIFWSIAIDRRPLSGGATRRPEKKIILIGRRRGGVENGRTEEVLWI